MKFIPVFLYLLIFVVSLQGCGDSGDSDEGATSNRQIASVSVVDGNNQTGTVQTELPIALMAEVENSDGQIISGQTVNFTVVAGGGSVFAGAATSDANGIVRERWTLGATAGVQTVEVRAVDSNGVGVVYATFHATAIAGEPYTVSILSENNQLAHQIQSLPATVFVEDIYGNPNSGVSVTFVNAARNPQLFAEYSK